MNNQLLMTISCIIPITMGSLGIYYLKSIENNQYCKTIKEKIRKLIELYFIYYWFLCIRNSII